MKDYAECWNRCLQLVRENLPKDIKAIPEDDTEWVFNTWFEPITFECYNTDTRELVLRVPSQYICEYIEHYRLPLWSWALRTVFGNDFRLSYRVGTGRNVAGGFLQQNTPHTRLQLSVPGAREHMERELLRVIGPGYQWIQKPYDKIVEWLSDNKGRGLLCVGTTGRGKSLLCQQILPVILGNGGRPIASIAATDLKSRLDELLHEKIVIIDDLGKEPRKYFGNVDNSFFELCNNAERTGNLLIITTNLSTTPSDRALYPESIQERYGAEVLDRLKSITRMVRLEGESLRR